MNVKLRPLLISDALISFKWRNNKEIWLFTGNKPDREITYEIEEEWIKKVLNKTDEKRFAICVGIEMEYIGNAQLTNIDNKRAQYHLFIGNTSYWGKGIASEVAKLISTYAFEVLNLDEIYSYFKPDNIASIKACEKVGFVFDGFVDEELLYVCKKENK